MHWRTNQNKYKNIKTEIEGIKFDSKKEARRYIELLELLESGEIENLKLQPHFTLQEAFKTPTGETVRAITYIADFSYEVPMLDVNNERYRKLVVEDVKSPASRTQQYELKKKMMLENGYKITEV